MSDSLFDGIDDAEVFGTGNYFKDGVYLVEIQQVVSYKNRKNIGGFRVETKILESTGPTALPVGSSASYATTQAQEGFLGNVKGVLQQLATELSYQDGKGKVPVEQINKEFTQMAVSDAQPFAKIKMRVEAVTIETKKEKKPFTKIEFTPYTPAPSQAARAS